MALTEREVDVRQKGTFTDRGSKSPETAKLVRDGAEIQLNQNTVCVVVFPQNCSSVIWIRSKSSVLI